MSLGRPGGPEPNPGSESQYDRYEFMKIDGAKVRERLAVEIFAGSPDEQADKSVEKYSQKLAQLMFKKSGSLGMRSDIDHENWWETLLGKEDGYRHQAYIDAFEQREPNRLIGRNIPASDGAKLTINGIIKSEGATKDLAANLEMELDINLDNLSQQSPRDQLDYLGLLLAEIAGEEVYALRERFQKPEYARSPAEGLFTRLYNRLPISRREDKSPGA